jgi:hypothetical protein
MREHQGWNEKAPWLGWCEKGLNVENWVAMKSVRKGRGAMRNK